MLRKTLGFLLCSSMVAGVILGSESLSYLRTFGGSVKRAVQSEISPEFELQRLQDEVAGLMPEVRSLLRTVAEQTVDLRDLEKQIEQREQELALQQKSVLQLRDDLKEETSEFVYAAVTWTRAEVEAELEHRFAAFCRQEETLDRDRQIQAAMQGTLRANQSRLDAVLSRREELDVDVAQLENRLRQIEAAEAVSTIHLDETRIADVEKMIRHMNHELDVRESILESEGRLLSRIPVESGKSRSITDVLAAVDQHFGDSSEQTELQEVATVDK